MSPFPVWCLETARPIGPSVDPGERARLIAETATFTEASDTFARRFGYTSGSQLLGVRAADLPGFWLLEDPARLRRLAATSFTAEHLAVQETTSHGDARHLECALTPLSDGSGLQSIWGQEHDVTREVVANDALRQTADLHRRTLQAAVGGIFVLDESLAVLDCNEAFCQLLEMSRGRVLALGKVPVRLFSGQNREDGGFGAIVELGTWRGRAELTKLNGTPVPIEISCRHIPGPRGAYYCFIRDLSGSMEAAQLDVDHRQALAHVSRISALGEMTSGIAHELNQPLAAIVNYANGCLRRLDGDEGTDEVVLNAMRAIVDQSQRAAEIIAKLRSFTRRTDDVREPFSLADLLTDAIDMITQNQSWGSVEILTAFADDADDVVVDGIQLEQVALHLLMNALDSVLRLPSGRPRRITLATRVVHHRGDDTCPVTQVPHVEASILDSGPGIAPEAEPMLFHPFFTTKPDGLGLGLTISRSIIESHGGRLWRPLDSVTGDAKQPETCFRFTLPLRVGEMPA